MPINDHPSNRVRGVLFGIRISRRSDLYTHRALLNTGEQTITVAWPADVQRAYGPLLAADQVRILDGDWHTIRRETVFLVTAVRHPISRIESLT